MVAYLSSSAARPSLRFIRLGGAHIFDQLRLEEVLQRLDARNSYCIANAFPAKASLPPTVVTGFGGRIPELVDIPRAKSDGINVIRRYTGGGTVIVDGSTVFVTFILNRHEVGVQPYPRDIMDWSGRFYEPLFQHLSPNMQFRLRENDYVDGDHKIAGNAQAITRDRFVHHTSFLWDFDPKNMQYLLMPKKRPEYRQDRDHTSFLRTLSHYQVDREAFISRLETRCADSHSVEALSADDAWALAADLLLADEREAAAARARGEQPGQAWQYRTKYEDLSAVAPGP